MKRKRGKSQEGEEMAQNYEVLNSLHSPVEKAQIKKKIISRITTREVESTHNWGFRGFIQTPQCIFNWSEMLLMMYICVCSISFT